jgi:predicted DNA-binding protein (MmcQ/YjbR family)
VSAAYKFTHPAAKALRAAAMAFPGTTEDFPWGHPAYKVAGKKAFCFLADTRASSFPCR